MRLYRGLMGSHPTAVSQMLLALDFHLGPVQEFAIVGDPNDNETKQVLRAIRGGFHPRKVVALQAPGADKVIPLLADKKSAGKSPHSLPVTLGRNAARHATWQRDESWSAEHSVSNGPTRPLRTSPSPLGLLAWSL